MLDLFSFFCPIKCWLPSFCPNAQKINVTGTTSTEGILALKGSVGHETPKSGSSCNQDVFTCVTPPKKPTDYKYKNTTNQRIININHRAH